MTIENSESIIGQEKFQIDINEFKKSNLSFNFLVIDKFFQDSSRNSELMSLTNSELFIEIAKIDKNMDDMPEDHLLKKFVLPGTSLIEAVFRILILNGNKPMDISEMEENLKKAWATVIYLKSYTTETISQMLNVSNEYFITYVD
jgi:hypothetical protein|tara:strand:+ start:5070 stop:5504 length:435 start_codon:yes stop_codon:yes gene_type:complete